MSLNIHEFYKRFTAEYKFLYDCKGYVAGYNEAIEAFDKALEQEWFRKFVGEFINYRKDFISSDREAAAFMFTLDSMTA